MSFDRLRSSGKCHDGVGIDKSGRSTCIYNALTDGISIDQLVETTDVERLKAVPATLQLAGAEIELVSALSREHKLRRAIDPIKGEFDFIIIDCAPSLGLLTINALTAADES